jgi:hypothetical protein
MSSDLQSEVQNLRERVAHLERRQHRRQRVTNQKGAAEYINKSPEWLRQQNLKGTGPRRNPNGTYDFAALDKYLEQNPD